MIQCEKETWLCVECGELNSDYGWTCSQCGYTCRSRVVKSVVK